MAVRERPNMLLLVNDHQAYCRHGWDAGVMPRRPHFDRLATGGTRSGQAFTASALCVPARRTMATGLLPHTHGLIDNNEERPQRSRDFWWLRLAEVGYRNLHFGKWHQGLDTGQDNGCEGFSLPSCGNPYGLAQSPEHGSFRSDLSGTPEHYRRERNRPLQREGRAIVPSPMSWEDWATVLARCYPPVTRWRMPQVAWCWACALSPTATWACSSTGPDALSDARGWCPAPPRRSPWGCRERSSWTCPRPRRRRAPAPGSSASPPPPHRASPGRRSAS